MRVVSLFLGLCLALGGQAKTVGAIDAIEIIAAIESIESIEPIGTIATTATPANNPADSPQWIGAISRADARIPAGRSFGGGKLQGEAKALWEAVDPLSRRSIIVGRLFKARKGIRHAELQICGLGFYELTINNRKVGDAMFAPLCSDYDKTLWYNTYDVTDYLQKGNNDIAVLLGNGFYNEQGGRYAKMRISFGPPTLYFKMTVTYQNGTTEQLVSDGSWRWCESPVTFNSIYGGEDFDARLVGKGGWHPVVVQEAPQGTLRAQIAEPVKLMERYAVKQRLKTFPSAVANGADTLVFDMGQNLSGFPEITVSGKAGQTVKLTVGETLTPDGRVNQRQTGRPHYYIYTLSGNGTETWHPRFSYYGYRYIEVEGAVMAGDDNPQGLPVISNLQSCFVYNSARKTGDFECSNPLFNDAYRIIDRAIRSNWQGVWSDCPHREKLGWLEQDWLNGEGLVYNYDCRTMIEQTVQNMVDAQHADGSMPEIAPEYTVFEGSWATPFLESPEWGGALIALPMLYYTHYGDDKLIRQHYTAMKRYVDYLHTQDSCFILRQGLGDWYDYGEGRAGFSKNTPMPLVSTAHLYWWTVQLADAARLMGHDADATALIDRAGQIAAAFNKEFYHPDTRQYGTGSQCSNAIPLVMGLCPADQRVALTDSLVADIHAHGDRLTTGDVGNRYLFKALWDNGEQQLWYKMLNHYDVPGYGYQLKKGMTTLSEQWNPEHGASMNHFMMAHINNHLIPDIVGIKVGNGAVQTIAPCPLGDMTWARGTVEVAGKPVSVAWKIEGGTFSVDIDVPAATQLIMPYSRRRVDVSPGHNHFEEPIK